MSLCNPGFKRSRKFPVRICPQALLTAQLTLKGYLIPQEASQTPLSQALGAPSADIRQHDIMSTTLPRRNTLKKGAG